MRGDCLIYTAIDSRAFPPSRSPTIWVVQTTLSKLMLLVFLRMMTTSTKYNNIVCTLGGGGGVAKTSYREKYEISAKSPHIGKRQNAALVILFYSRLLLSLARRCCCLCRVSWEWPLNKLYILFGELSLKAEAAGLSSSSNAAVGWRSFVLLMFHLLLYIVAYVIPLLNTHYHTNI